MTDAHETRTGRQRCVPVDSCSAMWDRGDLPAWGTATRARFWMALEQPGPWGRDAFTASRLDPELGARVQAAAKDSGGRALLIRRPGRSAEPHVQRPRTVLLACGAGIGRPTLYAGQIQEAEQVLDLPWSDLGRGLIPSAAQLPGFRRLKASLLLVCTNARRDICCARRGLHLAQSLHTTYSDQVWECTHTGGHRFAPTGVLLPQGAALARLDGETATAALASPRDELADAVLSPRTLRGLAHLSPQAQAVDAYVRAHLGWTTLIRPLEITWDAAASIAAPAARGTATELGAAEADDGAVSASGAGSANATKVATVHVGDTRLRLAVTERTDATPRPISCGRAPGATIYRDVRPIADE